MSCAEGCSGILNPNCVLCVYWWVRYVPKVKTFWQDEKIFLSITELKWF